MRDQVRAPAQEAVVEHLAPHVPAAGVTQQRLAGVLGAVHRGRAEVVPGAPVQVQDNGAESERLGGGARDRRQQVIEVLVAADEPGHLQQATQSRKG